MRVHCSISKQLVRKEKHDLIFKNQNLKKGFVNESFYFKVIKIET